MIQDLIRDCPTIRVKTFTHDYYMLELPYSLEHPLYEQFPDYANNYDFRGNHIKVAPVARVYGTNEYGQKCCCHIHGFFPFFYIKTDDYTDFMKKDIKYVNDFLTLVEDIFQKAYKIFKPIIVKGELEEKLDFYGYHESPETFLKISVYDPSYIYRLRELIDSNAIGGRSFQCYEAHINYHMQLFTEFNIFGIHEMKISGFTFRRNLNSQLMDLFKKVDPEINGDLMTRGWNLTEQKVNNPHLFNCLQKVSTCYIEIDLPIQSILNSYVLEFQEQLEILDSSNSDPIKTQMNPTQQEFKVKITKALEEVWIDEKRRRISSGIKQMPVGIIDYSNNLEGNSETVAGRKDPLWINFLKKQKRDGTKIIDQFIGMIRSGMGSKEKDQRKQITITREVIENYNDVLHDQREDLINKVKERWKYYGQRKVSHYQQIITGEKDELPEWDASSSDNEEQFRRQQQFKENEMHIISNLRAPGATVLYRNNYSHQKANLKKNSYFDICQYCRKKFTECLCRVQLEETLPTKNRKKNQKVEEICLSYKVPPPSKQQIKKEEHHAIHQRPFYSNIKDLWQYYKINPTFKPSLKHAQILVRELKQLKDKNRKPITIRNDLKLPDYFQIFEKPQSSQSLTPSATFCLRYDAPPPSYSEAAENQLSEEEMLPRRSTSLTINKEDTFVSDLMIFQYQFIAQVSEGSFVSNPQKHPIACFVFKMTNFKDYTHHIKGLIILQKYTPKKKLEDIVYGNLLHNFDDIFVVSDEKSLLSLLILLIFRIDPDLLVTYDQQKRGIRYLAQRGFQLGINFQSLISRSAQLEDLLEYINFRDFRCLKSTGLSRQMLIAGNLLEERHKVKNKSQLDFLEKKLKASLKKKPVLRKKFNFQLKVLGRVNLNLQRICEQDSKQKSYTIQAVNKYLTGEQICSFNDRQIFQLMSSELGIIFSLNYIEKRIEIQSKIIFNLNMIAGIIEKSKIYGADFVSMMERGSQFKIQSVMCRVTKKYGYVTLSASKQQVANQAVLECVPFVMEPPKQFYSEPVLLFDFQSLYPSVMIAYNLCYSTCLGSIHNLFKSDKTKRLGVCQSMGLTTEWLENILQNYSEGQAEKLLEKYIFISPNKVAFVKKNVREGIIPRILLIMIKKSIPLYSKNKIKKMLKERQIALKLFMNVMYGYTGASFTGRMPCSEIADSVVDISKFCLRKCIDFLNGHEKYKGKVLYGDTDSIFFHTPHLTIKEALKAGKQLQVEMTKMFPYPMEMKFQKAYESLFLVAKKRYYGKFYEDEKSEPKYEGKGLECVRRDGINLTSQVMREMLNELIDKKDLSHIKNVFRNHYSQLIGGFKKEDDIYLAKEVKLNKYSEKSCPAHGQAAKRLEKIDPMLIPIYGERMKYVVIKSSLKPLKTRSIPLVEYFEKKMMIDWQYYAEKQFLPPLARVFSGLVGVQSWVPTEAPPYNHELGQENIFLKKKCLKCSENSELILCNECLIDARVQKDILTKKREKIRKVCQRCIGFKNLGGEKCIEWNCPQFSKVRKIDKLFSSVIPELSKITEALDHLNF